MRKIVLIVFLLFLTIISVISAKSGSIKLLAVSNLETNPRGSVADLFLEVDEGQGRVFIDSFPLSKLDTQISTRFAKEVACSFLERDCSNYDFFYTIRANSAIVGGPSAGAAIAVLTISVLEDLPLDKTITITGTINSGGIIGPVGGILKKITLSFNIVISIYNDIKMDLSNFYLWLSAYRSRKFPHVKDLIFIGYLFKLIFS